MSEVFPPTIHQGEAHLVAHATLTAEGTVSRPIRRRTVPVTRIELFLHHGVAEAPGRMLEAYVDGELICFEPGADFADAVFRFAEDIEESGLA